MTYMNRIISMAETIQKIYNYLLLQASCCRTQSRVEEAECYHCICLIIFFLGTPGALARPEIRRPVWRGRFWSL